MKLNKRVITIIAAVAAFAVLVTVLAVVFTKHNGTGDNPKNKPGTTTSDNAGEASKTLPTLPGHKPGEPYVPPTLPDAPTQVVTQGKDYRDPNKIPVKTKGEDTTNFGIPKGLAEIYAVDGKLLFSHVTRWESDSKTGTTTDYYTMFEYHPEKGGCSAISGEVGAITRAGNRFVYDKSGKKPGDADYWDVPYYVNSAAWNSETEIDGLLAQQLIFAPQMAMIDGKRQPYTAQRVGTDITVTLLESGKVYSLRLDPKAAFGQKTSGGISLDIRGVANDTVYVTASCTAGDGAFVKELFALKLDGSKQTPIRYGNQSIWAVAGEMEDDMLYGVSIIKGEGTSLLKIDTATNKVTLLAKVKEAVWRFVATDSYALYEIPAKDMNESNQIKCVEVVK